MSDDIGGSVRAAYDKLEGGSGAAEATPEPASAPVETAPVETQESAPEPVEAAESAAPEAAGRDDKGRFTAPGAKAAPVAQKQPTAKPAPPNGAPAAATPTAAETTKPALPAEMRAPQAWKVAVKEKWAALDPDVRAEILRREKEYDHNLKLSAGHRQVSEQFRQVVDPYLGMIQAEGGDPYKAVGSLLQTAAALRTAPPQYKAQLVAGIIHQFGVPIDALDAALAGKAPAQGEQPQQQPLDVSALTQQIRQSILGELKSQAQTSYVTNAQRSLEEFVGSGKAEFLDELKPTMAALLNARVATSLEDAYNQAARIHPEVSKVLAQREQAAQATATQAATQRAKAASSSVASRPVGGTAPRPQTLRGDIEDAWSRISGR